MRRLMRDGYVVLSMSVAKYALVYPSYSPYFPFDPGSKGGEINFTDASRLPMMKHLVRDHIRDH